MDSIERMRLYHGERSSPPAQQPIGAPYVDLNANPKGSTRNFGSPGLPNPVPRSPNHINHSPSRSPGLPLAPSPSLIATPQYVGYPVYDNTSGMYAPPPGYFHSPPQTPQYRNGYEQFGGGELGGIYSSYMNTGVPMQEEQLNCVFPSYSGRKLSLDDILTDSMSSGKLPTPAFQGIMADNNTTNCFDPTSTAGTYTHFGPMNPILAGLGVRNNNNEGDQQHLDFNMKQWQQQTDLSTRQDQQEMQVGHATTDNRKFSSGIDETPKFVNGGNNVGVGGENYTSISPKLAVIGSGKLSPVNGVSGNDGHTPRALTPNGTATSYSACLKDQKTNQGQVGDTIVTPKPQVSGKPSYLEILTKNSTTNGSSQKFRRSSSSSIEQIQSPNPSTGDLDVTGPKKDSPSLTSNSNGHIQPLLQLHLGGPLTHRKSSDGFTVLNSSPGTSNSSTASSSPITKPKTQQKGKENYLSGFIKTTSKTAPVSSNGTPAKQQNEKKVQNGGIGNGKKVTANGRAAFKSQKFDFEIDDLDDDESDYGTSNVDVEPEPEAEGKSSRRRGKGKNSTATNGSVKTGVERFSSGSFGLFQFGRKGREKTEKPRSRKEERNCLVRRFRLASKQWLGHLISALTWFWSLLVNVATLSAAVGYGLSEDLGVWWTTRALPWVRVKSTLLKTQAKSLWEKFKWKEWLSFRKKEPERKTEEIENLSDLLAMLGPERNIVLPANGDEALRRLQSVKGQDPYSILGVRSNSPDETIRRYYKKQAVLVHPDKNLVPGAEEAFKILARAFELVGEPVRRTEYHKQLLEAHAKERFMGEFGNLFEQLRKKLESACTTIRCTKCNARHKKNRTSRPVFAARYCAQCRIHHGAREGELWAEKGGIFGFWTYYACMGNQVWEINEWGKCQSESLKHLNANSHNVLYRLVSGGQGQKQSRQSSQSSGNPNNPSEEDLLDPEMDDWDSLINNLCRGAGSATGASNSSMPSTTHKGGSSTASNAHANGNTSSSGLNGSASAAAGRKRKGKRK